LRNVLKKRTMASQGKSQCGGGEGTVGRGVVPETSTGCPVYIMYVGEHDGEICFHSYSKEEIAEHGIQALEPEIYEHTWWERQDELDGHLELG
jgi:hypothetical protein